MPPTNILILNDGSVFLRTLGQILESRGCRSLVMDSPEEGMEVLSTRSFDLVILKMNGEPDRFAVLQMVRELNPHTRLILIAENPLLPLSAYQVEVDDYILMPCRPAEIWRRILSCLKTPQAPAVPPCEPLKVTAVNGRALNKVYLMFHDVRESLVSIMAAMKLLGRPARGSSGDDYRTILQETHDKAHKLTANLEDFLRAAIFSDDGAAMAPAYSDICKDVVDPVLDELWEELHHNRITIDNGLDLLPGHLGYVKGDKVVLRSIFRNMLSNAIRYGGKGCLVKIDFDHADPYFRLHLFNSGPSIPLEIRDKVFVKFNRAAPKDREKGEGLGLGLYLSREIVRSYGGDILYEPKSSGSNFQLILPSG